MTDTMFEYEKYSLDEAIVNIHSLLESAPKGKAKDFYMTMQEVMTALSFAVMEMQAQRRSYDKMCKRVELLESHLALLIKNQ